MKRRAEHEPGFVLHAYPYKETSLVVEAFTRSFGRVGLLARGARRPRSMLRGVLLAFHPLRMTWSTSAELGTLISAEWGGGQPTLAGIGLMCGFYINELLLRLLPRGDPHEALFDAYGAALARLAAGEPQAPVLRGFERRMLAELGYAPVLDRDAANAGVVLDHQPRLAPLSRSPVPPRIRDRHGFVECRQQDAENGPLSRPDERGIGHQRQDIARHGSGQLRRL